MPKIIVVNDRLVSRTMLPRSISSRKGENGIMLVVGASNLYHGAPLLSSMAGLRSGIDLVYTAVPQRNVVALRSYSPNIIVIPFPHDSLGVTSAKEILRVLPKKPDAAAIGMGLHIAEIKGLSHLINELKGMRTKLLLDASALIPDVLNHISGTNSIITPHLGEFKRVFSMESSIQSLGQNANLKILKSAVVDMAEKYGITIILKGEYNVIASAGNVSVIKRSTPAMTVGGTGDVLSGLVAGLLTKLDPFYASITGIYINGLAALQGSKRLGLHLVASDLIDNLPYVMKKFDKTR
ncbi:MAG TPA: NAD(P)H-hydrate dehydratase [Nitrososphaeraceae archaeon]|nr:NAD(P)H-hydrate dehydratase [Nitrososphaeraceae archaeon]